MRQLEEGGGRTRGADGIWSRPEGELGEESKRREPVGNRIPLKRELKRK